MRETQYLSLRIQEQVKFLDISHNKLKVVTGTFYPLEGIECRKRPNQSFCCRLIWVQPPPPSNSAELAMTPSPISSCLLFLLCTCSPTLDDSKKQCYSFLYSSLNCFMVYTHPLPYTACIYPSLH
jgi:hypothetical protein